MQEKQTYIYMSKNINLILSAECKGNDCQLIYERRKKNKHMSKNTYLILSSECKGKIVDLYMNGARKITYV